MRIKLSSLKNHERNVLCCKVFIIHEDYDDDRAYSATLIHPSRSKAQEDYLTKDQAFHREWRELRSGLITSGSHESPVIAVGTNGSQLLIFSMCL